MLCLLMGVWVDPQGGPPIHWPQCTLALAMLRELWEVSGFQDSTRMTKGDFSRASLLEGINQNGTSVQKVGHSQL